MFAVGFNLKDFLRHVTSGSVDFIQPFSASAGNFAYPMFSLAHFWDWLNAGLLIARFGSLSRESRIYVRGRIQSQGFPSPCNIGKRRFSPAVQRQRGQFRLSYVFTRALLGLAECGAPDCALRAGGSPHTDDRPCARAQSEGS